MDVNSAAFQEAYEQLNRKNADAADIFAGETAKELAPVRRAWIDDRIAMQEGYLWMQRALDQSRGVPQSQWDPLLEKLAGELVDAFWEQYATDLEKKMYLVSRLAKNDETEVEALAKLPLGSLKKMAARRMLDTMEIPLNQMTEALAGIDEKQEIIAEPNAAAMAVAACFADSTAASAPCAMGALAGMVDYCNLAVKAKDIMETVCFALMVAALVVSALIVLGYGASVIAAGVAHITVEGTVAGVGAAITQELAITAELYAPFVQVTKALRIAGGVAAVVKLLTGCVEKHLNPQKNTAILEDREKRTS